MMKNTYKLEGNDALILVRRRSGKEYFIRVDKIDLPLLEGSSWYINEYSEGAVRVQGRVRVEGQVVKTSLHRFLLGFPEGIIDHINHDALDNRRSNLRVVDKVANGQNQKGAHRDSYTGVRGVDFVKAKDKFRVRVKTPEKTYTKYFTWLDQAEDYASYLRDKYMPYCEED